MYPNFSSQIYQDLKLEGMLEQNLKGFAMSDKLVCRAMMFNKNVPKAWKVLKSM